MFNIAMSMWGVKIFGIAEWLLELSAREMFPTNNLDKAEGSSFPCQ